MSEDAGPNETPGGFTNEQTEILRAIWNEMKGMKSSLVFQLETMRQELSERIDRTNERLDRTNERLDWTNERLDRNTERLDEFGHQLVESEMRVATALTDLAGDVRSVSVAIKEWRGEHRGEVAELRRRVDRIEERLRV